MSERATLDCAWRYSALDASHTARGESRVGWRDGNREPRLLDLATTRAKLRRHGLRLSLRYPIFNMPTSKWFHIRQLRCLKRASGTTSARQRVFYTMLLRIPPGAESTPKAS